MKTILIAICMAFALSANAQSQEKRQQVLLETTAGNIRLELFN